MMEIEMDHKTIDPQEHVDAIYQCAGLIQSEAATLRDCHTLEGQWSADDHNVKSAHDAMLSTATAAETAAEAFIDLQTERDEIEASASALIKRLDMEAVTLRELYDTLGSLDEGNVFDVIYKPLIEDLRQHIKVLS